MLLIYFMRRFNLLRAILLPRRLTLLVLAGVVVLAVYAILLSNRSGDGTKPPRAQTRLLMEIPVEYLEKVKVQLRPGVVVEQLQLYGQSGVVFGPGGKDTTFYISRKEALVIFRGREGEHFSSVGAPIFSPDGKVVAYEARNARGSWIITTDGKTTNKILNAENLVWSPVNGQLAYYLRDRSRHSWSAIVRGRVVGEYPFPDFQEGWELENIVFSPDGERFAFVGNDKQKDFAVIDGKEGKHYDKVWEIRFSFDGERVAYNAQSQGREILVLDGKELELDAALPPQFIDPHQDPVCPENLRPPIDRVLSDKPRVLAETVHCSPDKTSVAYVIHHSVGGGSQSVFVNGKEVGKFEEVFNETLAFDPDGTHVSFGARDINKILWVVVSVR